MSNNLQPPADVEQKLAQAKNAGALYHHLEWALKLLGQDPASLPPGEYVLSFKLCKHTDGGVVFPQYDLSRVEEEA